MEKYLWIKNMMLKDNLSKFQIYEAVREFCDFDLPCIDECCFESYRNNYWLCFSNCKVYISQWAGKVMFQVICFYPDLNDDEKDCSYSNMIEVPFDYCQLHRLLRYSL